MPHKYILEICLNNIIDYNIIIADMLHEYDTSLDIINTLEFDHHLFYFNRIRDLLIYLDNTFVLNDLLDELILESENSDDYKLLLIKLNEFDFRTLINS